jgi:hypothetical protein
VWGWRTRTILAIGWQVVGDKSREQCEDLKQSWTLMSSDVAKVQQRTLEATNIRQLSSHTLVENRCVIISRSSKYSEASNRVIYAMQPDTNK